MTDNPGFLPSGEAPRNVLFLAYPNVGLLDLTGPQTVFWVATKACAQRGLPGYAAHTISLEGGLIHTAEGAVLHSSKAADFAQTELDTLIVPGSPHIEQVLDDCAPMIDWLRQATQAARRTASVCRSMSPRNFARVYKQKTGRTPARAVEVLRLEAARRLLEQSSSNVDEIASLCGFGDEERMRVTFQRHLATSPRDYRKRFSV